MVSGGGLENLRTVAWPLERVGVAAVAAVGGNEAEPTGSVVGAGAGVGVSMIQPARARDAANTVIKIQILISDIRSFPESNNCRFSSAWKWRRSRVA